MILSGCNSRLIGNGFCNDETNNAEGSYDGGDCCGSNVNTDYCSDCKCYKVACAAGIVPHPMVGDGFCNDEANHLECNFDGGDCCGSCVFKQYCSDCECLGGENTANGFSNPSIGDGVCHDENNVADCSYDGGDCCSIGTGLIGNGFCNIETNNAECNYDGGDCCGPDISCKYQLIRVEFKKNNNNLFTFKGCSIPQWHGDTICDDENNNEACFFDGGDCCGSDVNTQYCSECLCYE